MTRLDDTASPDAPSRLVLSDRAGFINDLSFEFDVSGDGAHAEGRASITPMMRSAGSPTVESAGSPTLRSAGSPTVGSAGSPTVGSAGSLVRPSVLLVIADCIAGVPAMHVSSPRLAVTLDMMMRVLPGGAGPELVVTSDLLKQGRNIVASEVRFTDAGSGALAALGLLTFMTSARPQDLSPPIPDGMAFDGSLPVPFPDRVGLRVVAPGITELDRRPFVEQASGSLQGGMVALLGETAAESLTGRPVRALDARFFTGVRVGPGRATAEAVGDGLVRVEVRDAGRADRLAALVTARVTER